MTLRPDLAEAAVAAIGLEGDPAAAADSVLRVVNNNMAAALRLVSTARGIDPRDFTLVAYGGGGPLHAALVAEEVGIGRVLVPWSPGLVSAFGLLVADLTVDVVRTSLHLVDDETLDAARVRALTAEGHEAAAARGFDAARCETRLALDLRYPGQAYEITVWFDRAPASAAEVRAAFSAAHRQRYGYARDHLPVEAVNYRVRMVEPVESALAPPAPMAEDAPSLAEGAVSLGGAAVTARFAERTELPAGFTLAGPAVIEEPTATTLVPPDWRASVLGSGDLMIERN